MTDDAQVNTKDSATPETSGWSLSEEELQKARLSYYRSRRIRLASTLEITALILATTAYISVNLYLISTRLDPAYFLANVAEMLTSAPLLAISFALIVDTFQMILTGRAILVSVLVSLSEIDVRKGISGFVETVSIGADLGASLTLPGLLDAARRASQTGGTQATGDQPLHGPASDPVERVFERHISRSQRMVEAAQRRPNALLFVGVIVAGAGLAVFIFTIPGLFAQPQQSARQVSDLATTMMELLPKLLMLLFVQVLAGFFLRQYRVSMVELRYYEAVLRYRESQYISYLIRTKSGADKPTLQSIGKELLTIRDFLNLRPGETNMFLETSKLEENEFKGLYERIMDAVDKRLPASPLKSPAPPPKRTSRAKKAAANA